MTVGGIFLKTNFNSVFKLASSYFFTKIGFGGGKKSSPASSSFLNAPFT
jgi:hypothetical protein